MPIPSYTDLFTDLGKFVKATDQFHDAARSKAPSVPDFNALLAEIQTRYESQSLQRLIEGLESTFNGFRDASSANASLMASRGQARLLDRDTVINNLPGADVGDIDRTLREIYNDMLAQSETINKSNAVIGVPTFVGSGNGTLQTTLSLDGVSPPTQGAQPFSLYRNEESQFPVESEVMSLTCIRDEDTDGVPEGEEVFLLEGQPISNGTFGWKSEGSGTSLEISTNQAAETIANRGFEAWNANVPTNWSIEAGNAGTNIIQETTAADVHRGASALRLDGTGSDIRVVQELAANIIEPRRQYDYVVYIKTAGVTSGNLIIRMESPSGGYTAPPGEEINLNTAALQALTTYAGQGFYLMANPTLPEDLRWVVRYEGSPNGSVWIDSMGLSPLTYGNGVGFSLSAGSTQFQRGDRFSLSISNTEAIFQRWFRRRFGFQLPNSGTPTIPDSLAQ